MTPPFRTVLCAVDFGPGSERALVQAADLSEHGHGALHLVHVEPVFRPRLGAGGRTRDDAFLPRLRLFVDRVLGAADAFEVLAPEVHGAYGQAPADGVLGCARDVGADLIVLGTHGRQGLDHFLLGSVARDVVRRSPTPVWVVPERAAPERAAPGRGEGPRPGRPVVVAVDLSDSTVPLLRLGGAVAEARGTSVVPVHVREAPPGALVGRPSSAPGGAAPPMSRLDARAAVAEAVRGAAVEVGDADTYVVRGSPSRAIVDVAERAKAGLVVTGTHGRTGLDRLRLGSVAEWVVRHAPCPVLTVPASLVPSPRAR